MLLPLPREVIEDVSNADSAEALHTILQALTNETCAALATLVHFGIERITGSEDRFGKAHVFERFVMLRVRCRDDPRATRDYLIEKRTTLPDHLSRGLQMVDEAGVRLATLEEYWDTGRDDGQAVRGLAAEDLSSGLSSDLTPQTQSVFTFETSVEPTREQEALLEASASALDTEVLKTIAMAGTGKTTMCEFIAKAHRGEKAIYLAFNKIMDEHARNRIGHLMECRTVDSLAYSEVNPTGLWGAARTRRGGRCDWSAIGDALGLPMTFGGFKRRTLAQLLHQTVTNYCYSADSQIGAHHIARAEWPSGSRDFVLRWATDLWYRMLSPNETIPVLPPQVMKYWQLNGGSIPYDLMLVDEAQDLNPVFLEIVKRSECLRHLIGDPHQQLYEWRGAIDAMSSLDGRAFPLTRSWRFGPEVAHFAHAVLTSKSRPPSHRIIGNPGIESKVTAYDPGRRLPGWPITILARTNAQVFRGAVDIAERGHSLHVVGDIDGLRWLLLDALSLFRDDDAPRTHWKIAPFRNWSEFLVEAEVTADRELKRVRDIVETRCEVLERQLETLRRHHQKDSRSVDAILATTHRVKGREWNRVMLLDDFIRCSEYAGLPPEQRDAELNVLYVAATRARFELYVPEAICPTTWSSRPVHLPPAATSLYT